MACPNCGNEIVDNRRFCGKCGTEVNGPAPAPAPPPSTAPPTRGAPGTWGAPASSAPPPPPAGAAPPPSESDPFAAPNLYGPPPGTTGPPPGPAPGYPPPGYGAPGYPPPTGYPTPGYPPPGPPTGYPPQGYPPGAWTGAAYPPQHTNGLAIASLILGLVGWAPCGIGSVLAIVFGFVAREQIKRAQGREGGQGMATAGIILGFVVVGVMLLWFVIVLANSGSNA